jgi:ribosomal protein S17E
MDITTSLMNIFFSNRQLFDCFYKSISKKNRNRIKGYILVSPLRAKKLEKNKEIVVWGFLDMPPIWCKK